MSLYLFNKIRDSRNLVARLMGLIESKPITERIILRTLFFVIIGGILTIGLLINNAYVEITPIDGGTLVEGVVGIPRFVNPALAVTRADQDMTALIYSGLMKIDSTGKLAPDVAKNVTVSNDGKTYNVILRNDVTFHDGTSLTAKDVAFTIGLIQNPDLKSPLRSNWSDVMVKVVNDYELNIIIAEPYTPFIENFTLGILPRHIWSNLPIEQIPFSQHNTNPIGSGPFIISNTTRDDAGLITSYMLKRFSNHVPTAKLANIKINFYHNVAALVSAFNKHDIVSTAYLPADTLKVIRGNPKYTLIQEPLPRVFGIFFNQNHSAVLRDLGARQALSVAINRQIIVNTVLDGFGIPTAKPIPPTINALKSPNVTQVTSSDASSTVAKASAILTKAGWTKNSNGQWEKKINKQVETLHITLKTANNPVFEQTAQVIARAWRNIGVQVQVDQFEQSDLLQAVIRPRDFQALLFGIDMNRSVDLYPFWHSSQREDPGLNIAGYANIEVDSLLQKIRASQTTASSTNLTNQAVTIINKESPAIFLFAPNFTYVVDSTVSPAPITRISTPSERFMNISDWHMNTDKLWHFFR